MQQTATSLTPKPGHYFHEVDLGGAKITLECRDETDEDDDGRVCLSCVVIEGALINGFMVKAQSLPESLVEQWAEEVEAERTDAETATQRHERQQRAWAHYGAMAAEAQAVAA